VLLCEIAVKTSRHLAVWSMFCAWQPKGNYSHTCHSIPELFVIASSSSSFFFCWNHDMAEQKTS